MTWNDQVAETHCHAMSMLYGYIYLGLRTPVGRRVGAVASLRPDDLLATAIRAWVQCCAPAADHAGDVMVGCADQAGDDSRGMARHAARATTPPKQRADAPDRLYPAW